MEPLRILTPASYWTVYTVLAVLVFETIASLVDHDSFTVWLTPAVVLAVLAFICFWLEYTRAQRWVEIDKAHNEVSVYSVSLLLEPRVESYRLDMFDAVRSHTSFGGSPENRIELVTNAGGDSLLMASFSPRKASAPFWSWPSLAENPDATALRQRIAAHTGLTDLGFAGTRFGYPWVKD